MSLDSLQPAQQLLDSLRSLPWAAHALALLALLIGLVLWFHGRRLLKPTIVAFFALAGGGAGFVLPSLTPLGEVLSVHAGLMLGAAIGAILGFLLFRFAMAISLGLVLAAIAPVVCVAVTPLPPPPASQEPLSNEQLLLRGVPEQSDTESAVLRDLTARGDRLRASLKDAAAQAVDPTAPTDATAEPASSDRLIRTATQRVRAFADALADELAAQWDELPSRLRVMILGSASVGLGLGIILGLLLPRWTSGAVTAMLGAAIWLPALVWLLAAAGLSIPDQWHPAASNWLIAWAAASGIGTLIQWRGLKRQPTRTSAKTIIVTQG